MLAAALLPSTASAAGVVVALPGREVRLDEAALRGAADVPAGTYTLRGEGGTGDTIAHPPAVSLPRVLELAGVAPDALSFVAVTRPNGTLAVLRAGDLARPAPFPDGPPLVWLDADSVRFLRPVRDAADANGADNVATAGEDLRVRVHQGPLLQVAVRIDPGGPRAGRRAHLEAQVRGARAGAAVTVRWRFGDGSEATGPAAAHRWRRPGVYAVVASADGDDDSGGASEPVVVTVGAPRARRGEAGGGRGDRERAPATGQREPPGASDRSDAPASRPDAGDAQPPRDAGGAAQRRAADAARRHAAEAQRRRAANGAARGATGARSRRDASAPGRRADVRGRPPAARRRATRRAAPSDGEPVRGVLVAATVPAADAAAPPAAAALAARTGGPATPGDLTLPVGAALAAALLALGARRERRR